MADGRILNESDYAQPGEFGWKNFAEKKGIQSILLFGREISKQTFKIPKELFRGYAIHQIGSIAVGGKAECEPNVAREVMMVQTNEIVYVCCLNLITKKWHDYLDSLINPRRPHLIKYDLAAHGM